MSQKNQIETTLDQILAAGQFPCDLEKDSPEDFVDLVKIMWIANRDPALTPISRRVLNVLIERHRSLDPSTGAWPSVSRIAFDLSASRPSVLRAIKQLESFRYIDTLRRSGRSTQYFAMFPLFRSKRTILVKEDDVDWFKPPTSLISDTGINSDTGISKETSEITPPVSPVTPDQYQY